MKTDADNTPSKKGREESDGPAFDFWSDEGARRFNEALNEGTAYVQTQGHLSDNLEGDFEEGEREHRDSELGDANDETLPPGEMELIFENSYIM